jgi:simple sugar transport system permease protein
MAGPDRQKTSTRILRRNELGVFVAVVGVALAFAIDRPQYFPTLSNSINIIFYLSPLAFVSFALTIVLVNGEFDLSVGSTYSFTGIFLTVLVVDHIADVWTATILTIALGAFLGFANGIITLKTGIPSLIVTLGTMLIYESAALIVSNGYAYVFNEPKLFYNLFGGFAIGSRTHLPALPTTLIWIIGTGIVLWVYLNKTKIGNWSRATGDKPWAALTSGVPIKRVKMTNFIICSLLATLGSIITVSQIGGADPVTGAQLPFEAIGASVIGGTSLYGGYATILGALMGALLIAVIENGLAIVGANVFIYEAAIGGMIIIAAGVNIYIKKRGERA